MFCQFDLNALCKVRTDCIGRGKMGGMLQEITGRRSISLLGNSPALAYDDVGLWICRRVQVRLCRFRHRSCPVTTLQSSQSQRSQRIESATASLKVLSKAIGFLSRSRPNRTVTSRTRQPCRRPCSSPSGSQRSSLKAPLPSSKPSSCSRRPESSSAALPPRPPPPSAHKPRSPAPYGTSTTHSTPIHPH